MFRWVNSIAESRRAAVGLLVWQYKMGRTAYCFFHPLESSPTKDKTFYYEIMHLNKATVLSLIAAFTGLLTKADKNTVRYYTRSNCDGGLLGFLGLHSTDFSFDDNSCNHVPEGTLSMEMLDSIVNPCTPCGRIYTYFTNECDLLTNDGNATLQCSKACKGTKPLSRCVEVNSTEFVKFEIFGSAPCDPNEDLCIGE